MKWISFENKDMCLSCAYKFSSDIIRAAHEIKSSGEFETDEKRNEALLAWLHKKMQLAIEEYK